MNESRVTKVLSKGGGWLVCVVLAAQAKRRGWRRCVACCLRRRVAGGQGIPLLGGDFMYLCPFQRYWFGLINQIELMVLRVMCPDRGKYEIH
jgi:hypothetical protein